MTNSAAIDRPVPVMVSDIQGLATVSVDVAAAFLGVAPNTLYAAARAGEIKSLRLGRRVVIPVLPLLAMVGAASADITEARPSAA